MLNYCDRHNETPLLVSGVNIKLLKTLIEYGANLFHLDNHKRTILHKAMEYLSATDYFDLLQFIPKATLNSLLQVRKKDGTFTSHMIVQSGLATPDILQLILSNGVDINTSDEEGCTCIFYTVDIKNEDIRIATVKLLLKNGADHTRLDSNGDSIIHHSAFMGRIDCLRFFLEEKKMNVNQINKKGITPIFSAVKGFDLPLETVEFLLERGAEYKIVNKYGENLLHYAAKQGKLEYLKLFLTLGGLDINLADEDGNTPLLCALDSYHRVEKVRLLLANGADHTILDKKGNNGLHHAAVSREAQYISELVGLPSLDVNARNCDNDTPLHSAIDELGFNCFFGDSDLCSLLSTIKALVSVGSDVNARNNHGQTPLAKYKEQYFNRRFRKVELNNDLEIRRLLEGSERKSRPNQM